MYVNSYSFKLIFSIVLFLNSTYLFSQKTIYVNNVTGSDALNGLSATIIQPYDYITGPKQSLSNAIEVANPGDTISVAKTDSKYYEGSILINKDLILTSSNNRPVFTSSIQFGQDSQSRINVKFISEFEFLRGITLVNCSLTGGNYLYVKKEIKRFNISTLSGQINLTDNVDIHYINTTDEDITIETGDEFPQSEYINKLTTSSYMGAVLTLKLNQSKTIYNSLNSAGPIDLASYTLSLNGYKHTILGKVINGTISFNGSVDDTIVGTTNGVVMDRITINKNSKSTKIVLENNLEIKGFVTFKNGLIITGENILTIPQLLYGNGQAFDRSQVTGNRLSHVVGYVAKYLINTGDSLTSSDPRVEFPVGNSNFYRQVAFKFKTDFGLPTIPDRTNVIIGSDDKELTGINCLPVITLGGTIYRYYPNLNWTIHPIPHGLSSFSIYDLEFICEGFNSIDEINNLRIIEASRCVSPVGISLYYDNKMIDGIPLIIAKNVMSGFVPGQSSYTIGPMTQDLSMKGIKDTTFSGCFEKPLKYFLPGYYNQDLMFFGHILFSATSSDITVATVQLKYDTLYVTCVGIGSTNILIKLTDETSGDFFTDSFELTVNPLTEYTISGKFTYENALSSPLNNVIVTLNPVGLKDTTDLNGNFSFNKISDGNYSLSATSFSEWLGANASDALNVAKHYAGILILTGLSLEAADVNNSGSVNNTDAMLILRKFVDNTTVFTKGNWIFQIKTLNVNGSDVQVGLSGLAVGDVNGSDVP